MTGNLALAACMMGAILVVLHSDWFGGAAIFVVDGLLFGYLACLVISLRWMKKQRSHSSVMVIDQREAEAERAVAGPVRLTVLYLVFGVFQALTLAFWITAFPHMSSSAILATVAVLPVLVAVYFVRRFVILRFWEDLLFAAAVVMAYTPFLLQTWSLTPLSFVSLAAVVIGTICLHQRWTTWARSLSLEDVGGAAEEGQS